MEKFNFVAVIIVLLMYIESVKSEIPLAPALYVFGDSIFDSGNNNVLPTLAKADFKPYGSNFDGGRATGRFTNGKTVADFIAEFLGLPFSPPYLSLRGSLKLTGLNYASGSCGILPYTGNFIGKCLHFSEQVDLFERTVERELPRKFNDPEEFSSYLSRSIFVVSTGSNDYVNNYLQPNIYGTSKRYTPDSFAKLLVDALSQQLQRLYRLGARKIIMFEIGPIGCIPSFTKKLRHNGRCNEEYNALAVIFNNQLSEMLKNLTSTLQGSAFILGHGHWLGYDAIINPSAYGLMDPTSPCCITWGNGTSACIPELEPCGDADKHYFWDGYHLTETIYRVIATKCFNGTSLCIPKNIKELVED
ncbi:GDSL esterase/lipase 7-like [Solanum tuberosum]|uniref:GDSL esterase/lipase 7-like n=1 Tax=Solanum tuberosum TaxID=4113 RepID=UPI0003D2457D|nr:PREDICTED: GDSL esterase/lipase 7-like [Solanum tuberosum]